MNRGAWQATVYGITKVGHDLATTLSFTLNAPISFMIWDTQSRNDLVSLGLTAPYSQKEEL